MEGARLFSYSRARIRRIQHPHIVNTIKKESVLLCCAHKPRESREDGGGGAREGSAGDVLVDLAPAGGVIEADRWFRSAQGGAVTLTR